MSIGIIYNKPNVAKDVELPWPYCQRLIIWRNGVGMPTRLLPEDWRERLKALGATDV